MPICGMPGSPEFSDRGARFRTVQRRYWQLWWTEFVSDSAEVAAVKPGRLSLEQYIEGVLKGDRVTLARAITLVESERLADLEISAHLLDAILPHTGMSRRVGITGVPGAGKSTLIDALGVYLIREQDENIAVLSVDPASPISGGSILGDKTRMERLCSEERAFIRPSSSRGRLGGVAPQTHEAVLLCEAAGFSNVLIETMGVGQSEIAGRSISDFLLLLL